MKKGKSVIELVPAKKYYGKHATGSVVLVNGQPEYHHKTSEARRFYMWLTMPKSKRQPLEGK